MATEKKEWLSIETLAAELDVPVKTIYRWRYHGEGPRGAKFGRHIRFERADVDAWIESRYLPTGGAQ